MITTSKVNFGKDLGPMQLFKHVVQSWNRKPVLDGDIVDDPRIHTHPPRTILLRYQKSGNWARTQTFPNVPM